LRVLEKRKERDAAAASLNPRRTGERGKKDGHPAFLFSWEKSAGVGGKRGSFAFVHRQTGNGRDRAPILGTRGGGEKKKGEMLPLLQMFPAKKKRPSISYVKNRPERGIPYRREGKDSPFPYSQKDAIFPMGRGGEENFSRINFEGRPGRRGKKKREEQCPTFRKREKRGPRNFSMAA